MQRQYEIERIVLHSKAVENRGKKEGACMLLTCLCGETKELR